MNLEEARNNIGEEVELDESTKPYTHSNGQIFNKALSKRLESIECLKIDFITRGNVVVNTFFINPKHLKLKPQNYKIHVQTEAESREAQELFFELGYSWRSGNKMPKYNSYNCVFTVGKIITVTDFSEEGKKINAKQITIQDLRDMVSKKRMKEFEEKQKVVFTPDFLEDIADATKKHPMMAKCSIGDYLKSGEDKTVQVTGTFQNFEPRKEMTWQDALRAVADDIKVEFYNELCGQWWDISHLSATEVVRIEKFRIAPKRIYLHGNYTKEELLKEIGEME